MKPLSLPLRQQKILKILLNQTTYITGTELARQLNVSPRTIRNDITEMNQSLAAADAQILSVKSKGYQLIAPNPESLTAAARDDTVFQTREDRVRYLAFQLCLSDIPIHLFDLEEEMAVSHTTLENDLHTLKLRFVHAQPHIRLYHSKNEISFEPDENKRREILNRLFREDWDYDNRGNAYYGYQFLDPTVLDIIMAEVPGHLQRYRLQLEDSSLVALNLAIAILYHRVKSGHPLPPGVPLPKQNTAAMYAVRDLADSLEHRLRCPFSQEERDSIYRFVAFTHLLDADKLNFQTAASYFGPNTIEMADHYLKTIEKTFRLDFSNDEDFYITLLQFIRSLQTPLQNWNIPENMDIAKDTLAVEFEFACLFQHTAADYLGYYLNEAELLYLAHCISGALEYFYHHHPEHKLKTVICSHLNLPGIWALKRKVLGAFANYIDVTALLPINGKSAYDFTDTDLVLTTVRKEITDAPNTDVLRISPYLDASDHRAIERYISRKRIWRLCPHGKIFLSKLLKEAFWHEKTGFSSHFSAIETLGADFTEHMLVSSAFTEDILRREALCSFSFCPGILFLHSLLPAYKTRLSVATLDHQMVWGAHKVRLIVMASFTAEDAPLLFALLYAFYQDCYQPEVIKTLKSKEAVIAYYEGFAFD